MTLSARECQNRKDKRRQVTRRVARPVFGTAIELRGFSDWIIHRNVQEAVDKFFDYALFDAVWQRKVAVESVTTPVVACRQQSSLGGIIYAALKVGEAIPAPVGDEVDFSEVSGATRVWAELEPSIFALEQPPGGRPASAQKRAKNN